MYIYIYICIYNPYIYIYIYNLYIYITHIYIDRFGRAPPSTGEAHTHTHTHTGIYITYTHTHTHTRTGLDAPPPPLGSRRRLCRLACARYNRF